LRSVAHLDSWEKLEENRAKQPGLFDFVKPGSNTRENAARIAGDIAAGWRNQPRTQAPNQQASDYPEGYDYPQGAGSQAGYGDNRYANPDTGYDRASYDELDPSYDELDQGWENFDHYDSPPPPREGVAEKRVYGDSLYGSDSREEVYREGAYPRSDFSEGDFPEEVFPEEGFPEEGFLEDPPNEMGPDGVYEADYRVIEPPSKPLDDDGDDVVG